MRYNYVKNPRNIERESFRQIRELTDLDDFDPEQCQVVLRIVHSVGLPEVAQQVRFSSHACAHGLLALAANRTIFCDTEMVKHGISKHLLRAEPVCYLNDPRVLVQAKSLQQTRAMAALSLWLEQIEGSVVIIGNAPTALFYLLEMIAQGAAKPALIIAMPVGFVGAEQSKLALWEDHEVLGLECITLLGRQGGSAVSAATCNALLRCNQGQRF